MQLHELVKMDGRFIRWLANRDSRYDIDRALEAGSRYLLITETNDRECSAAHDSDLEKMRERIGVVVREGSGWQPVALFDLREGKELKFAVRIEAEFTG